MGKRKKKNKGNDDPNKRMQVLPLPVPDDRPNWPNHERHEVMMSVLMEFIPPNFEKDYIAVICPVAKRRTVVAADGWTCSYNKLLNMDRKFQSALPGGNLGSLLSYREWRDICILDCLHYKAERTFYILDMMMWRRYPYYDSETGFRFHWISQVEQEVDLTRIHPENEYMFKSMPRVKCSKPDLYNALANTKFKVDGILFFHQACPYMIGSTPQVLWLPPENMQSVLGMEPPPNILPSLKDLPSLPASAPGSMSGAAAASYSASD